MADKDPTVNWGDIPEGGTVPSGTYLVAIEEIERTLTKEARKLMYSATYRVKSPKALKGQPIYDNFVIGNDDDPAAEDPETWKSTIGAKNLKRLFKAAGVDVSGGRKVSKMISDAGSGPIIVSVSETKETKGEYKGRMRNNVTGYYAEGTKEPGLDEGDESGDDEPKPKRRAADDEDDALAPKKKAQAEDEDEGDEPKPKKRRATEDDDEPAPKRKAANGKAADDDEDEPPKSKGKVKMIQCSLCEEQVERNKLEAHLDKVHADD